MAQVAVLEGRNLIEHYVSRPADDVSQIHGNIYVGRVQNVLPGMEAAFVDIATPKNAVLYRGDVQYDAEDIVEKGKNPRIEDILRNKQLIICQVTKNPIGHKGARLTQEVSLPGRFVVLIPNSTTYGISKRLPDDVRKRLRGILDRVKPAEHGLIVRTAAEAATEEELRADMMILLDQWEEIAAKAAKAQRPALLYREPELAVRVIREEFNADYRGVVIDDERLFNDVRKYVAAFNPDLADRIEYYDAAAEGISLFEKFHVHEQVHKALDRKVWLPSGGSLIIEHTEALTVIDVNTGKNVGSSNLEATVFHNNMEAAEEIAKQLRLRDIGGIIVIDFIDMEIRENRAKVVEAVPQRARPRQDPLADLRHLRTRPRGDDPQAHRRGAAAGILDRSAPNVRAAASRSTTACSSDGDGRHLGQSDGGQCPRRRRMRVENPNSAASIASRYVCSNRLGRQAGKSGRRPAGPCRVARCRGRQRRVAGPRDGRRRCDGVRHA